MKSNLRVVIFDHSFYFICWRKADGSVVTFKNQITDGIKKTIELAKKIFLLLFSAIQIFEIKL